MNSRFLWQGQKDSNPQQRFWRPTCYHYTMPLRSLPNKIYITTFSQFCQVVIFCEICKNGVVYALNAQVEKIFYK